MHTCSASPFTVGTVTLALCSRCGQTEWTDRNGHPIDPAEGLAEAYGSFELTETLPAIHAPGGRVLVYRIPRRHRNRLAPFTAGTWVEIYPDLYASQDGANLLLAPANPLLADNLRALG